MTAARVPDYLRVTQNTFDVLQELQVILGVDKHGMPARALEATVLWYDEVRGSGNVLRFSPPPGQSEWRDYTRSIAIDEAQSSDTRWAHKLLVEGEAHRRLAASEDLMRLASVRGLEQMVRLRAEEAFRRADDWTIEIVNGEGAST